MNLMNYENIMFCLYQLADEDVQRRYWLSDRLPASAIEAIEGLFGDSNLSEQLKQKTTGLPPELDNVLIELDHLTDILDCDRPTEEIIADPLMSTIRRIAKIAFDMLTPLNPTPGKPNEYIESCERTLSAAK